MYRLLPALCGLIRWLFKPVEREELTEEELWMWAIK